MDSTKKTAGFSKEEQAAMRERARGLAAEAKIAKNRAAGEKAIFDAIAVMSESDKVLANKIHELIKTNAPELFPKTWYGMPAYANKEGKVVCFFQGASKFNYRYATLGFQEDAHLDDGNMWAASFALLKITDVEEKKIVELIKRAVS